MLTLPPETERLAERLAAAQGVSPADAVRRALENSARSAGIRPSRRRRSLDAMLADAGAIAALPLLDPRSPKAILDELNDP